MAALRVDLGSFGLAHGRDVPGREALERSMRWRRTTTTYLAEIGSEAVGTARTYDMELSTPGGASVPVAGIGDVGVLPGFRGRGVLRCLVERILDDATDSSRTAAVLYASESTIYGRFGFGPATRSRRVSLPVHKGKLRADVSVAEGRCELLEPEGWIDVLPGVFERAARRRGGEVSRSAELWEKVLCAPGDDSGLLAGGLMGSPGADGRFAMVQRDPGGSANAYALYSVRESWQPEGPAHEMFVDEVVAVDAPSELALWRSLLGIGLVQRIEAWLAPDAPLLGALLDRWAPSVTGEHDKLWARVLDPLAALASRRYRIADRAVVAIGDPRSGGEPINLALTVERPGDPGVTEPCGDPPDVTLGVAELGEVWLGGGSLAALAAVGRVAEAAPGEAARLDAMLGWSPLPQVTHDF